MTHIISFINSKGGVAKTTSTCALGYCISRKKYKVLLIDLDPQAHLSHSISKEKPSDNLYNAFHGKETLIPISLEENLDLISASIDLSAIDTELSGEIARELILKNLLNSIKDNYDFIFIDCSPSLSLLTVNALVASSELLIPIQAHYLAVHGLSTQLEIIEKVQTRLNQTLKIGGVFLTFYDARKVLNKNVEESLHNFFGDTLFKTKIRTNIALAEAPSVQQSIFDYAPKSNGSQDYQNLCEEFLERYT